MYKRVSGTPELQEEMIKDFREAEDLWNKRSLWIGEKYIYKPLYGIFPKSEANCFFTILIQRGVLLCGIFI